jgi:peptide deformylase
MVAALDIRLYGDPILRTVGQPVTAFDATLQQLYHGMLASIQQEGAAALAAQQVGVALQFFVVHLDSAWGKASCVLDDAPCASFLQLMPLAMANPRITPLGPDTLTLDEGCMSLPGMTFPVQRPSHIRIDYQDLQGHPHSLHCHDYLAICIQHEYDHLQGVLIIDKTSPRQLAFHHNKLKKLQRHTLAQLPQAAAKPRLRHK